MSPTRSRTFMMVQALGGKKRQLSNWKLNKLLLSVISPITSPHGGVSSVSHDHLSGMTPAAARSKQTLSHQAKHPRLKQKLVFNLQPLSTPWNCLVNRIIHSKLTWSENLWLTKNIKMIFARQLWLGRKKYLKSYQTSSCYDFQNESFHFAEPVLFAF